MDVLGEQPLEVGLDAVLDQAGVHAQLVGGVVEHLVDVHREPVLGLGVLDPPDELDALGDSGVLRLSSARVQGGDIQFSGL